MANLSLHFQAPKPVTLVKPFWYKTALQDPPGGLRLQYFGSPLGLDLRVLWMSDECWMNLPSRSVDMECFGDWKSHLRFSWNAEIRWNLNFWPPQFFVTGWSLFVGKIQRAPTYVYDNIYSVYIYIHYIGSCEHRVPQNSTVFDLVGWSIQEYPKRPPVTRSPVREVRT